jgi:bifunctional NMN adenylyltransferase/nudix hydrolase
MPKLGVVIARFQVPELHAGHKALIQTAADNSDALLMLLGVSPLDGKTLENPLLFTQRCHVLDCHPPVNVNRKMEAWPLPLYDMPDNASWSAQVDKIISSMFPGFEPTIFIGPTSKVIDCYNGTAKIEVIAHHDARCGTDVRGAIIQSENPEFIKGQIYALGQQFPTAYQCVDLALMRNNREVLLIQRADTGKWCLPGGFVDPALDTSLEHAAKRELLEETGLSVEGDLRYATSTIINDWRYRGRDKIMSALFVGDYAFGHPRKSDEVSDSKWLDIFSSGTAIVDPCHELFIRKLQTLYADFGPINTRRAE